MEYKKTGEIKTTNVLNEEQQARMMPRNRPPMMPPWNHGSMMPGNNSPMMPGNNGPMMPENNGPMMPGNNGSMMPGNNGSMMPGNNGPMMPGGCPPMMMPGSRPPMMMPGGRPPMVYPPYPVYPPNMPVPYYYGDTVQGMQVWNENNFTEEDLDRELEQIMEMYPSKAKEIQKKVAELCDTIDYEGSILYDEHPDRFVLGRYSDKIYEEMVSNSIGAMEESVEAQEVNAARRPPCKNCRPNDGMRDLIDVLFFNEIFRRRCRKGRCRRW